MTEILIFLSVIALCVAVVAYLLLVGGQSLAEPEPQARASVVPFVQPVPELTAPPLRTPPEATRMVTVRLLTLKRRPMEIEIPASHRRPKLVRDLPYLGRAVFQCSHRDEDGVWVYRLTDVERT